MSDGTLPAAVQALVGDHFETNADVDVLLLVRRHRDRRWNATGVADGLRLHPDQVERILGRMAASGLLRPEGAGYRYAPRTPRLADAVDAMAALHPSYRFAIATLIFTAAPDRPSETRG